MTVAVPSNHPLRRVRAVLDHALAGCVRKLARSTQGRAFDHAQAQVRACVLMKLLDIRNLPDLRMEVAENPAAMWFVGPKSLPTITAHGLKRTRSALRDHDGGVDCYELLDAVVGLDALSRFRRALRQARRGQNNTRAADAELQAQVARAGKLWLLTPRQIDVLGAVVVGLSNRDIAREINCASGTVELHVTALLQKSGTSSRASLVARFWLEA